MSTRPTVRRSFTLTELLVVIIIITILATVAIPSFSAMMYSSESALAVTRLTAALRAGRDAAIRSGGDADAALAFFYEPNGRLSIVPCLKVGELDDLKIVAGVPDPTKPVKRDVFVPVDFIEPVQLPRNWMVRGYAPAGSIDHVNGDWYEDVNGVGRYGLNYGQNPPVGDWIFPETGFYPGGTAESLAVVAEPAINTRGDYRQTFIVRFKAGTGALLVAGNDALIVSARPSTMKRNNPPFGGWRIHEATDLRRFVRMALQDPMVDPMSGGAAGGNTAQWRRWLLGDQSSDSVLARAVGQLALYDENKLASGLGKYGVQIDRNSGCIYALDVTNPAPQLPTASIPPAELSKRITWWIQGNTNFSIDGVVSRLPQAGLPADEPSARVFTIDRYSGEARPVEIEQ